MINAEYAREIIPDFISADIAAIRKSLGRRLKSVALFGSCVRSGFKTANDVDVALFVDGLSLAEARECLLGLQLTLPVHPRRINGSYGGGGGRSRPRDYDFVVLPPGKPRNGFIQRNEINLLYV